MIEEIALKKREQLVKEASRIGKVIRSIDKVLLDTHNILAYKHFKPKPASELDLAKINLIIEIVGDVFGFDEQTYLGPGRKREHVLARHCALYLAQMSCSCSLASIGALFSSYRKRVYDHATVLHAKKKVSQSLELKESKGVDPNGYAGLVEKCVSIYLDRKSEL